MTLRAHKGIWPALLTPVASDGAIRHDLLAAHAKNLLALGCQGVTLFGTTGEGPSFSVSERTAALSALIAAGVPADAILVHTSAAALTDATALSIHATQAGVHACLLMPPFFFKGVSDEGITAALHQVINAVEKNRLSMRAVLYHIPQVAGVGLSLGVIRALVDRNPGVILGIKDSACDSVHSLELAQAFMPEVQVWVGNELDIPLLAAKGTNGAVSGVANIMPRCVRGLVEGRDPTLIDADLTRVGAYIDLLNATVMLPTFKATMAILTGESDWARLRAPLRELNDAEMTLVRERLLAVGITDFTS
jgi:4-hydroxy-tetrahydrodipicolinate synthase